MDYGLLNAIGITILAAFGLWAFQRGMNIEKKKRDEKDE